MFREILKSGCDEWQIELSELSLDRLERFMELLIEKNRLMNLTAVTEPEEIARRHFLDCLFLLKCADLNGKTVLDIGSGAGFPSVPLKCAIPALDITPLDSTAKRMAFIEQCCVQLELDMHPISARAEEYVAQPGVRESYDIVTSRAVASLSVLCELSLPYVRQGGIFMPMKSASDNAKAEISEAQNAIKALGGVLREEKNYKVPGLEAQSTILIIEKIGKTPDKYPRRFAKIRSSPL